ncbi:MAG TPA: ABC transporter ATP-binding protein [Jatrophihabitantaceae bacterium]|jgi:oligopeptide/dipeptide ABC transporter ATP-binding protein|nr:ABC transporter ATP-binding protein [Jatrophihabitantaceae bacterium]
MSAEALLEVRDLSVEFASRHGALKAVRSTSFTMRAGETLAVLGESGSGKSVTAMSIMGLLDPVRSRTSGSITFEGTELVGLSRARRRRFPGRNIAMIFQDALAALNPVQTVGSQISEVLRVHQGASHGAAKAQAIEYMDRVRIPAAAQRYSSYPHQLSGGMRQRVMIAIALALQPKLLIADEPTTALDVTVQAQIMQLLTELRRETGMALLFITHDLGVSAEVADRIAVMYAGRIVETGTAAEVYLHSRHPYTRGLLDSIPRAAQKGQRLTPIVGSPPPLTAIPRGCSFHPRCPRAAEVCTTDRPELREISAAHCSACHFAEELADARG